MSKCSFQNDSLVPDCVLFDATVHKDDPFPALMSFGAQRIIYYNPAITRTNYCIHRKKVADCVWKMFLGRHKITNYDGAVKFFVQNGWENRISREICKGKYPSIVLPRLSEILPESLRSNLNTDVSIWPVELIRGTSMIVRRNYRYHECVVCMNDKSVVGQEGAPDKIVVSNLSNIPLVVVADDDSYAIIPHSTLVFRQMGQAWTASAPQD